MEYLNRVELAGIVGVSKSVTAGDAKGVRFSVVTAYASRKKDGLITVDNEWHNVIAWNVPEHDMNAIVKGAKVKITGRIRYQRYTDSDGVERTFTEILASSVKVID